MSFMKEKIGMKFDERFGKYVAIVIKHVLIW